MKRILFQTQNYMIRWECIYLGWFSYLWILWSYIAFYWYYIECISISGNLYSLAADNPLRPMMMKPYIPLLILINQSNAEKKSWIHKQRCDDARRRLRLGVQTHSRLMQGARICIGLWRRKGREGRNEREDGKEKGRKGGVRIEIKE